MTDFISDPFVQLLSSKPSAEDDDLSQVDIDSPRPRKTSNFICYTKEELIAISQSPDCEVFARKFLDNLETYTLMHSLQRKRSIEFPNNSVNHRNNSPLPGDQQSNEASFNAGLGPHRSYFRSNHSSANNKDWRNSKQLAYYDKPERFTRTRQPRENYNSYHPSRRFVSNNNGSNNNRFSRRQDVEESAPEWMDYGPESMNDFIDLKGFEDGDEDVSKADASASGESDKKNISSLDSSDFSQLDMSSFFSSQSLGENNPAASSSSSRFIRLFNKSASEASNTEAASIKPSAQSVAAHKANSGKNLMDMLFSANVANNQPNTSKLDLSKATTLSELESMMANADSKKPSKNIEPPISSGGIDSQKDAFLKFLSQLQNKPQKQNSVPVTASGPTKTATSFDKLVEGMQQISQQQQQQQPQPQQQQSHPLAMPAAQLPRMPMAGDFAFMPMNSAGMPMMGPMMPPSPFVPFFFPAFAHPASVPGLCPPPRPFMMNPTMLPQGAPLLSQKQPTAMRAEGPKASYDKNKRPEMSLNASTTTASNKTIYKNPQFVPTSVFRKNKLADRKVDNVGNNNNNTDVLISEMKTKDAVKPMNKDGISQNNNATKNKQFSSADIFNALLASSEASGGDAFNLSSLSLQNALTIEDIERNITK